MAYLYDVIVLKRNNGIPNCVYRGRFSLHIDVNVLRVLDRNFISCGSEGLGPVLGQERNLLLVMDVCCIGPPTPVLDASLGLPGMTNQTNSTNIHRVPNGPHRPQRETPEGPLVISPTGTLRTWCEKVRT
eukprot:gene4697-biopygen12747